MRLILSAPSGFLRAEVVGRSTPEEARSVVDAILAEQARTAEKRILVLVRESPAMFKVDTWNISGYLARLAAVPGLRIALASDSNELRASQDYIALLANQRGVNVRVFADEAGARQWLLNTT